MSNIASAQAAYAAACERFRRALLRRASMLEHLDTLNERIGAATNATTPIALLREWAAVQDRWIAGENETTATFHVLMDACSGVVSAALSTLQNDNPSGEDWQ